MPAVARRLSKAARREALLESGLQIFADNAYDALSTDGIAQLAGISKGLFYHYFGNKRGYYVATIQTVGERMLKVTEPDPTLDFQAALTLSVTGFVGFVQDHPKLFAALVRGGIGSDKEAVDVLEQVRETSVARVFARMGVAEPSLRLRARVYGWVGLTEAVCLDWVAAQARGGPSLDRDEVVDIITSALFAMTLQEAK